MPVGRFIAPRVSMRFALAFLIAALGGLVPQVELSLSPLDRTVRAGPLTLLQPNQNRRSPPQWTLMKKARLEFIRRAQVWRPVDVPNMDLRAGPDGAGAFRPNEMVTCDYTDAPRHGGSRKFHCVLPAGDVVKVRYGVRNGEVQGSVLATRLLWALGFAADGVYPVRVTCRGCSSDPWTKRGSRDQVHAFDPAVIERKPHGHQMWEDDAKAGWSWSEMDQVDARQGGAPQEQRDALKLLAVFVQHTDTKPEQQRLLCVSDLVGTAGECEEPFLLLHDVGLTFGRANTFNKNSTGSVNFKEWSETPIWRDPAACVGHLGKSHTGTLGDPRIGEAGRRFLGDLLVQLTDRQLRDLFEVAGVERRTDARDKVTPARVDDWIAAFKHKRNEIVTNTCLADLDPTAVTHPTH